LDRDSKQSTNSQANDYAIFRQTYIDIASSRHYWSLKPMNFIEPLIGGLMIGLTAGGLLLLLGRIAGISGILGRFLFEGGPERAWRGAFLAGLIGTPILVSVLFGFRPEITHQATYPVLALAGLLVGYGTQIGNGCTSGHGVCGLSNGSRRSLAATTTFMATAALVVFVVRHVLGAAL
jgi:uncharacterized protein